MGSITTKISNKIGSSNKDDLNERDQQIGKFIEKLYREGHTCVEIQETYPRRIIWCEKTPCENPKKF